MFLALLNTNNVFAQSNTKTDTITVHGNCGQCKERIEEAAYIKGVKSAVWDKQTKVLTIKYVSSKTSLDKISQSIAKVGHDNTLHNSTDKDYKKIPECCAYRSGSCDHD